MHWDEYYLNIAETVATQSKDPSTKVGCVIVSEDNYIISTGYNGFIRKCDENFMTFEKPLKDLLSVHAEMNALINTKSSLKNSIVYCTHASCENCLKHLVQAGVKKIIYKHSNTNGNYLVGDRLEAIKRIIKATNIEFKNINGKSFLDDI